MVLWKDRFTIMISLPVCKVNVDSAQVNCWLCLYMRTWTLSCRDIWSACFQEILLQWPISSPAEDDEDKYQIKLWLESYFYTPTTYSDPSSQLTSDLFISCQRAPHLCGNWHTVQSFSHLCSGYALYFVCQDLWMKQQGLAELPEISKKWNEIDPTKLKGV